MVASSQYKTETIFDYSWKQVVQAYWNRYPNPASTHVLTEDTICREVRNGKLYSRRILSKTNAVPKWGERFYKNAPVKIIEDSILDPQEKTLITFTRNIGFKKIMKVDEIVEYSEQPDGRTLAVRRAYISSQVFGFSRAIRAFGIERFKSNCHKASNGFNYVLRRMFPNQVASVVAAAASSASAKKAKAHSVLQYESTDGSASAAGVPAVLSKKEVMKKASKDAYGYLKQQAAKAAQMFSIRN